VLIPVVERILARIAIDERECWAWQGATCFGYGVVGMGRRSDGTQQTHRALYEIVVGPVPDGMQLDHLCRNRACCNPDHLEVVTRRENIMRGESTAAINARKTHCKRGHEFTPENVHRGPTGARQCITCTRMRTRGEP
jgi:hypothetical protein